MKTLRERMTQEMRIQNYSERTIACYLSSISSLSKFHKTTPDNIDIPMLKDYLHNGITIKGLSNTFINQTISAYKILTTQILYQKWDPFVIKRPKSIKKLPVILSVAEAVSVVKVLENLKHKAVLHLGYSAGLRISEVVNLKVEDVDSSRMQIRVVNAKGCKDRNVILSPTTLTLLRKYYKLYKPKKWLFEGGFSVKGNRQYSHTSIRKVLTKACLKSGITKHITFHTLRHSFATHLLENGTQIQLIQKLLGHTNLKTTFLYLHLQEYQLQEVESPLDFKSIQK